MLIIMYVLLFGLVLVSLLEAMARMATALDEADAGSFLVWTCVASVIAGLPSTL